MLDYFGFCTSVVFLVCFSLVYVVSPDSSTVFDYTSGSCFVTFCWTGNERNCSQVGVTCMHPSTHPRYGSVKLAQHAIKTNSLPDWRCQHYRHKVAIWKTNVTNTESTRAMHMPLGPPSGQDASHVCEIFTWGKKASHMLWLGFQEFEETQHITSQATLRLSDMYFYHVHRETCVWFCR